MAALPRVVTRDGFANVRDLGGMPISDRGSTVTTRVWRSAALTEVTAAGWAEARGDTAFWARGRRIAERASLRALLI